MPGSRANAVVSLALAVACAMLHGCNDNDQSLALQRAPTGLAHRATTSGELLYISDGGAWVYVFTFPSLSYVERLSVLDEPSGLCTDADGNVLIPQNGEYFGSGWILEYAHGGNRQTAMLADPGASPLDCAVDPTTGNLAVTSYAGQRPGDPGSVAFWPKMSAPKVYGQPQLFFLDFCTYDPQGDLFIDGQDVHFNPGIVELPRGATSFSNLTLVGLPKTFGYPAALAWYGGVLLMGDLDHDMIYRLKVKGSTASVSGVTKLLDGHGVEQFTISNYGGRRNAILIGPNSANGTVGIWRYPAGGKPLQTITENIDGAFGSVISKAASR
jgi:hypothetical protein